MHEDMHRLRVSFLMGQMTCVCVKNMNVKRNGNDVNSQGAPNFASLNAALGNGENIAGAY